MFSKKILFRRPNTYKRYPRGGRAPFSPCETNGCQRAHLYYSNEHKSFPLTMGLTCLSRTLAEDSACSVKAHTFSFWMMKSTVMCLARVLPKFPHSCSGNVGASHTPLELIASFIAPSKGSCCGRKVMEAVPKDSSEQRINILKQNLNLKKKKERSRTENWAQVWHVHINTFLSGQLAVTGSVGASSGRDSHSEWTEWQWLSMKMHMSLCLGLCLLCCLVTSCIGGIYKN